MPEINIILNSYIAVSGSYIYRLYVYIERRKIFFIDKTNGKKIRIRFFVFYCLEIKSNM